MKQGVLVIVWESVKAVFNEVMNFLLYDPKIEEFKKIAHEEQLKITKQKCANDIFKGLKAYNKSIEEEIGTLETLEEIIEWSKKNTEKLITIEKEEPKIHNCKNCGAPLHNNKCEYCGTEYGNHQKISFEDIETAEPLTEDRYNI